MKRQYFILIAAFSMLLSSMACGFLEREVAIEDMGVTITNFENEQVTSPGGGGGVEIASIDLSRVWETAALRSYRSESQIEIWFEDDTEESSTSYTTIVESTSNPPA